MNILTRDREPENLLKEVLEMRQKMRTHLNKSSDSMTDVKHGKGGLIDIEFLVQFLVLNYANQHPKIAQFSDNLRFLEALATYKIITKNEQETLSHWYCHLRDYGHRSALQNAENLMLNDEFSEIEQQVFPIIRRYCATSD